MPARSWHSSSPWAYYQLNETSDPSPGTTVAYDYVGGYNGVYGVDVQNGFENGGTQAPVPAGGLSGFFGRQRCGEFHQHGQRRPQFGNQLDSLGPKCQYRHLHRLDQSHRATDGICRASILVSVGADFGSALTSVRLELQTAVATRTWVIVGIMTRILSIGIPR